MKFFQEIVLRSLATLGILIFSFFLLTSCASNRTTRYVDSPSTILQNRTVFDKDDIIKLHLTNGDLYILDSLKIDSSKKIITGKGIHFDINRNPIDSGKYKVNINEIALIEVNDHSGTTISTAGVTTMAVAGLVGLILFIGIILIFSGGHGPGG